MQFSMNTATTELKEERAEQPELESLPADKLDRVVGGMFFDGEDAPDGHEMGCLISINGRNRTRSIARSKAFETNISMYVCRIRTEATTFSWTAESSCTARRPSAFDTSRLSTTEEMRRMTPQGDHLPAGPSF